MILDAHRSKIIHLLRRSGFTCSKQQVDALEPLPIEQVVTEVLQLSQTIPTPPMQIPENQTDRLPLWWLNTMVQTSHPLLEKMTLFWHGHFTSHMSKVPLPALAKQNHLLRRHALGNFRQLAYDISLDPAMMIWLDNQHNDQQSSNRNYARELIELFTMGLSGHTEADVREVARALTGWSVVDGPPLRTNFDIDQFDPTPKTILGRTGYFGLRETIDLLVDHPASDEMIVRKLWSFFAYPNPEPHVIAPLIVAFRQSDYEIAVLLRALFTSEHFYSDRAYRSLVKSPIEFMVWVLSQFPALEVENEQLFFQEMKQMGQLLFAPPNISGWPDGPAWLDSSLLFTRYNFVDTVLYRAMSANLIEIPSTISNQALLEELINKLGLFDLSTQTRAQLNNYLNQTLDSNASLVPQLLNLLMICPEAQLK